MDLSLCEDSIMRINWFSNEFMVGYGAAYLLAGVVHNFPVWGFFMFCFSLLLSCIEL